MNRKEKEVMNEMSVEKRVQDDQTVLVRLDTDVKVEFNRVKDDSRLRAALPTLRLLSRHRNRVIVMGHRGRPKGKRVPSLSLRSVAQRLSDLLKRNVRFVDSLTSNKGQRILRQMKPGDIVLLENLRFDVGEEENDPAFVHRLAALAGAFVNESFANAHRKHASVVGLPTRLPSSFGIRFCEEIQHLTMIRSHPKRPYVALIGGAKISSKAAVIKELCRVADAVLVGGALANTLLYAQNHPVGRSLIEKNLAETAKDLLHQRLRIPIDVVTSTSILGGRRQTKGVGSVQPNDIILDIGPDTVELYSRVLRSAKTIVWGGPMGLFEDPRFADGTFHIARAIAKNSGMTVAGGGDTLEAIRRLKLKHHFSFVSMGGGAMLQFLEGRPLPGIEAIRSAYEQRHRD